MTARHDGGVTTATEVVVCGRCGRKKPRDVRDGATMRVNWREGELTVTYDNLPTTSEAA
jgi:hypothetical protein